MRPVLSFVLVVALPVITASAWGQTSSAGEAPDREALLSKFVAQNRGDVTAIEASTRQGGGVVIGYASGAVLRCTSQKTCQELAGTPNVPVEQIAVSRGGTSEVIWVAYRQGALYHCAEDLCEKFTWRSPIQD